MNKRIHRLEMRIEKYDEMAAKDLCEDSIWRQNDEVCGETDDDVIVTQQDGIRLQEMEIEVNEDGYDRDGEENESDYSSDENEDVSEANGTRGKGNTVLE